MTQDPYKHMNPGLSGVANLHQSITSDDDAVLDPRPRCLYVTVDGNLVIEDEKEVIVSYPVTAGQILPFRPYKVKEATTATVIGWV